ncbi:DUF1194 domain-containing protein, partial [Cereibacter changlensis]
PVRPAPSPATPIWASASAPRWTCWRTRQTAPPRRIVNVSGDGRETPLFRHAQRLPLAVSRARAERMGVTVNGLAITGQDAGLAGYYRDRVALGQGSFVIEVSDTSGFAAAMKRKLLREIGQPLQLSALATGHAALR